MTTPRQPVIILIRGERVDVEASVFPVVQRPDDTYPSTTSAMFHGTELECHSWIAARDQHIELLGCVAEVTGWHYQKRLLLRATGGQTLPPSDTWRPPEERADALIAAAAAEGKLRAVARESLASLSDFARRSAESLTTGDPVDSKMLRELYYTASADADRHAMAAARLAAMEIGD